MTDARTRQADALVEGLQREAGGKLTVFLGAAPGVGKTYTMLTRAQEQLRRGVDLVVGLVETHGRADTQALNAQEPAPLEVSKGSCPKGEDSACPWSPRGCAGAGSGAADEASAMLPA